MALYDMLVKEFPDFPWEQCAADIRFGVKVVRPMEQFGLDAAREVVSALVRLMVQKGRYTK